EDEIRHLESLLDMHETALFLGSYTLPTFPGARIRLAEIQRDHMHDPRAAKREYERFLREFPDSTRRDDALLGIARIQFDEGETHDACETLRGLIEEYPVGHSHRQAEALVTERCRSSEGR